EVREVRLDTSRIRSLGNIRSCIVSKRIAPSRSCSTRPDISSGVIYRRRLLSELLPCQSAKRIVFERARLAPLRDRCQLVKLIICVACLKAPCYRNCSVAGRIRFHDLNQPSKVVRPCPPLAAPGILAPDRLPKGSRRGIRPCRCFVIKSLRS